MSKERIPVNAKDIPTEQGIFNDIWFYWCKYHEVEDTNAFWEKAVNFLNNIAKKWGNHIFAVKLSVAVLDTLEKNYVSMEISKQIFNDVWTLYKKFYHSDNSDEYWSDFIEEGELLVKKHFDNPLSQLLVKAIIEERSEQVKKLSA